MKLFVDDLRKSPQGWHHAKTISEAIRTLATHEVEEVSLDHDISHAVMMENNGNRSVIARPFPCGETFEPVAWFLKAIKYRGKVTLHTANPIGAKKMAEILADAGIGSETKLSLPANGLE